MPTPLNPQKGDKDANRDAVGGVSEKTGQAKQTALMDGSCIDVPPQAVVGRPKAPRLS